MVTFDKFVFLCAQKPYLAAVCFHVQKILIWDVSITNYPNNLNVTLWCPLRVMIKP